MVGESPAGRWCRQGQGLSATRHPPQELVNLPPKTLDNSPRRGAPSTRRFGLGDKQDRPGLWQPPGQHPGPLDSCPTRSQAGPPRTRAGLSTARPPGSGARPQAENLGGRHCGQQTGCATLGGAWLSWTRPSPRLLKTSPGMAWAGCHWFWATRNTGDGVLQRRRSRERPWPRLGAESGTCKEEPRRCHQVSQTWPPRSGGPSHLLPSRASSRPSPSACSTAWPWLPGTAPGLLRSLSQLLEVGGHRCV